ncbi:MAG: hypothetical protein WA814_00650 [Candidatus Baltobacteraceae bacterium]
MRPLYKGAVLAGAAALLLGAALALSGVRPASGATIGPDRHKVTCAKSTYCFEADNAGTGEAILGVADDDIGVFGTSANVVGVYGYSRSGNAGWFQSLSYDTESLFVDNLNGGPPFAVMGETASGKTLGSFSVDAYGNGYFSGNVYTNYATIDNQATRDGGRVGTFGTQSTRATIEDTGTTRLMNGEAAVRFDPTFASALDPQRGYQVFLTPDGETRGLYVAAKYEGGFIVRENERGRSTVDFDYRIVAHPEGASDARLPRLNLKPPPIPRFARLPHQ